MIIPARICYFLLTKGPLNSYDQVLVLKLENFNYLAYWWFHSKGGISKQFLQEIELLLSFDCKLMESYCIYRHECSKNDFHEDTFILETYVNLFRNRVSFTTFSCCSRSFERLVK